MKKVTHWGSKGSVRRKKNAFHLSSEKENFGNQLKFAIYLQWVVCVEQRFGLMVLGGLGPLTLSTMASTTAPFVNGILQRACSAFAAFLTDILSPTQALVLFVLTGFPNQEEAGKIFMR